MNSFRSCLLIMNRNPRTVGTFVSLQTLVFFSGDVLSLNFLNGLNPQTLTFLLVLTLIFGNIINYFANSISSVTMYIRNTVKVENLALKNSSRM